MTQSRNEISRGAQFRLATPTTPVAQHTGLLLILSVQRGPLLGTAIANATLAATVVITKNRMLMGSSWLGLGVGFSADFSRRCLYDSTRR